MKAPKIIPILAAIGSVIIFGGCADFTQELTAGRKGAISFPARRRPKATGVVIILPGRPRSSSMWANNALTFTRVTGWLGKARSQPESEVSIHHRVVIV